MQMKSILCYGLATILYASCSAFGEAPSAITSATWTESLCEDLPHSAVVDIPAFWRASNSRAPLVVFVHGGAWSKGDKNQAAGLAPFFNRQGYALASVNYRLAPRVNVAAQVADVCAGVLYLRAHASSLGVDAERVALVGHSAGANLAALATPGLAPRALVLLDGVGLDVGDEISRIPSLARVFGSDPATWSRLSPVSLARAGLKFPQTFVGYTDFRADTVPQAQSMVAALTAEGIRAESKFYPGRRHGSFFMNLRRPEDPMSTDVQAFLARALK